MTIKVACSACGKVLNAPDSSAGKKGKCSCGNVCLIPATVAVVPEQVPVAVPYRHGQEGSREQQADHSTVGETAHYVDSTPNESSLQSALPSQIGRYRVVRRLGTGGFGDVYLAHDPELNREVAIKVPRVNLFASAQDSETFLAEARRAASLGHPNLVSVFDVGRLPDNSVYVVMQYIEGSRLSEFLCSSLVDFDRIVEILASVADAVHFAHRNGIVHRDLKPENILVDLQGRPHVADFGLAVHEDEQRLLRGERSGTAAYMAPEQFRGEAHFLDGRCDVWALGVILYQLLARRRPFNGSSLNELANEVMNREVKPPRQINENVPLALEQVCLKCLKKPVSERYATAGDLAFDLRSAARSRPRRRLAAPGIKVFAISMVLATLVGGAWWYFHELPVNTFDRSSKRPAIAAAAELELTTSKVPDIFAALEELARVGWFVGPQVQSSILAAFDDLREPVRYQAVSQIGQWIGTDREHDPNEELLRALDAKANAKDDQGRPLETSSRVREVASEILRRFPVSTWAKKSTGSTTHAVPEAPVYVEPEPAVVEDLYK